MRYFFWFHVLSCDKSQSCTIQTRHNSKGVCYTNNPFDNLPWRSEKQVLELLLLSAFSQLPLDLFVHNVLNLCFECGENATNYSHSSFLFFFGWFGCTDLPPVLLMLVKYWTMKSINSSKVSMLAPRHNPSCPPTLVFEGEFFISKK